MATNTYKDQIKVLNWYQASPIRNFPLGTDRSFNHSYYTNSLLYIGDMQSRVTVAFKAFIEKFNIKLSIEQEEKKLNEGAVITAKNLGFTYNLDFKIPSISVDDALVNSTRVEMLERGLERLNRGMADEGATASSDFLPSDNRKVVLMGNLIQNGNYQKKHRMADFDDLLKYGLQCYYTKVSYEPENELGYFEYEDKIWPKSYSLSLELHVPSWIDENLRVIAPFTEDGKVDTEIEKYEGHWPFGVKTL
tara:strand:- start:17138 stop:17884 length:747 start_codon:yes stop_codon:yes gene_type:complete